MTVAQIRVKDLQSIKSAAIPVGKLTVIVGESNVGKSALVRALTMLARNGASTGLVRQGSDHLAVAALFADGTAIQVRRGARLSEYKIVQGGSVETFTKCGVAVPTEITGYLSLASSDLGELSFAGQHDPPFLLSQPASSVARQIGAITNAHLLNDAVRETNRRRLEAAQEVRSFTREAEECRTQLAAVGDLKARRSALLRCREAIEQAEAAVSASAALRSVLEHAEQLQAEIAQLERVALPGAEMVQAVERASKSVNQWNATREAIRRATELRQQITHEDAAAREWAAGAEQIEADAHRMLVEAGVCPACGQEVPA